MSPPVVPSLIDTKTHARFVIAPDESGPIPLYTSILPPLVIQAQLDTASFDAYTILHLIINLPVTITVRTPFISNILLPAGQSIVRSPFTARTLVLPFTAYLSISAIVETVPAAPQIMTGSFTVVVPVVLLLEVVDVSPLVAVMNPAKRLPGLRNA
jgi:hypothetical protein